MNNFLEIENNCLELPSVCAEQIGAKYSKFVNKDHKKEYGQFFTPLEIAQLMGTFANANTKTLKILDPGCGTGILSCSLIESICLRNNKLTEIELVLYEIDLQLIKFTNEAIEYLGKWLKYKNINLKFTIRSQDFVLENVEYLSPSGNLFSANFNDFDIIISNPPYFKLSINDLRVKGSSIIINGHPNIYSIFMAIAAKLLKQEGQLIFITPRSYASGSYFKKFREFFFKHIELDLVHLFVSRKDTFIKDKVLQETVIIKGTKKEKINPEHVVKIQTSHGLKDIGYPSVKTFPQKEVIDLSNNEKIMYLPTNDEDESILNIFKQWEGSLNKFNIQISTGPVVAFRAHNFIKDEFENGNVILGPLFWLHNIKQMILDWPLPKLNKGQYIKIEHDSKPLLIPNKNYVFLRRFSSKDDIHRLVAAPYFSEKDRHDFLGVENKVNYIYRPKGNLEKSEVLGLCALLNSTLFNSYFRIFNGNVNVSATELREISFPPLETIKKIGKNILDSNDLSMENVNIIVNNLFGYKTLYE